MRQDSTINVFPWFEEQKLLTVLSVPRALGRTWDDHTSSPCTLVSLVQRLATSCTKDGNVDLLNIYECVLDRSAFQLHEGHSEIKDVSSECLLSGFILGIELGVQFKLFYIVSLALGQHNAKVLLHLIRLFCKQSCFSVLWTKFSAYNMRSFLLKNQIPDSSFEIFHYCANFYSLFTSSCWEFFFPLTFSSWTFLFMQYRWSF